jgi:FKBP-type peptidyl-prolyl cis-trans isomerase SlyD
MDRVNVMTLKLLVLFFVLNPMKSIVKDQIVELKYTLREGGENGAVLEIMDEQWPLKFYYGSGQMLKAFESALDSLLEGQSFSFTLKPEEGYGSLDTEQIKEISFCDIPDSERFPNKEYEIGDRLVFNLGTSEERLGTICEVLEHSLLIDFNHALAGKDLHFSGQVLYIREPRQDEKIAQRYIEPNGIRSDSRLRPE